MEKVKLMVARLVLAVSCLGIIYAESKSIHLLGMCIVLVSGCMYYIHFVHPKNNE